MADSISGKRLAAIKGILTVFPEATGITIRPYYEKPRVVNETPYFTAYTRLPGIHKDVIVGLRRSYMWIPAWVSVPLSDKYEDRDIYDIRYNQDGSLTAIKRG